MSVLDSVYNHYENFEFYKGISDIRETLGLANKYFQDETPWNLTDPSQKDQLRSVIHVVVETLRVSRNELRPKLKRSLTLILFTIKKTTLTNYIETIQSY